MCKCDKKWYEKNGFGTYHDTTALKPHWESAHETITIDNCLLNEIKDLWSKGIVTGGCCCGHNISLGMVSVEDEYIDVMLSLGYKIRFHELDPTRRDTFIPKTVGTTIEVNHKKAMEQFNIIRNEGSVNMFKSHEVIWAAWNKYRFKDIVNKMQMLGEDDYPRLLLEFGEWMACGRYGHKTNALNTCWLPLKLSRGSHQS